MATSPSPFFPTTAPAYTPTTVFPPPPFGFEAPAYGHHNFPSAATYPPPLSTGGYSTSPFPFSYSAPPAFPYAATCLYPPPASAYTPASGFSPNWPTWPPPSPDLTPSNAPPTFSSFPAPTFAVPTTTPNLFGAPTPVSFPAPAYGSSDASPADTPSTAVHLPVQGTPHSTVAQTATDRQDRPHQRHASTSVDFARFSQLSPPEMPTPSHTPSDPTPSHSFMEDDVAILAATDERAQAKDAASHLQHREFLNLQARLDKQMACDRTSLDELQGELSKLSALVSQFAVSMGMETTEAPVIGTSPVTVASAQFRSPATTGSMFYGTGAAASSPASSLDASSTAYVTPQVFAEMPQPYGFDNLNRQTVLLADGTEHSYFALPKNYPLELATPEPVFNVYDGKTDGCSNELVHVFVTTPEQQPFEEEQQASAQLLKCVSKATETEQTIACLNHISHLFDYTLDQQQQDDEKTSVNVQQLRATQLNILVIHERRNEWDPGIHTILSSTPTSDIEGFLQTSILPSSIFILHDVLPVQFQFGVPKGCVQQQCDCGVPSRRINHGIQFLWDPGILSQTYSMLEETVVANPVYSGQTTFKLSIFVEQPVDLQQFWVLLLQSHSWYNILPAFLQVHYCFLPIVLDCSYSETVQQLVCYSRMLSSKEAIISALCMSIVTTVHMIVVWSSGKVAQEGRAATGVYHVFSMSKTSHIWDPGIESIIFLYKMLHVHMIQLVNHSAIHAWYFWVYALLPPTEITAYGSSNIKFGEITSRCLVSYLHQITNWTSTTANVIRSLEYGYTMDCPNGQWEFLHQQGVQKNYNAKNLLSSLNYLQIWEMDIIFITFLPP